MPILPAARATLASVSTTQQLVESGTRMIFFFLLEFDSALMSFPFSHHQKHTNIHRALGCLSCEQQPRSSLASLTPLSTTSSSFSSSSLLHCHPLLSHCPFSQHSRGHVSLRYARLPLPTDDSGTAATPRHAPHGVRQLHAPGAGAGSATPAAVC
jgi:hypothetical protein